MQKKILSSQALEIHFQTELGYFIQFGLGLCQAGESKEKKSALKSSWVSETNYQEHGWLVTGNALLPEMVSTPLMSSDQGWTSFRKVLCQMRSYWAQLVIISTSEFGMVDKEPEKVMTKCESRLVGFLSSSLSVIEWFWAQEWIECCLKCGWVSADLHLLSALCWLSSADSSKKLIYWLSMKYHLKIQSSKRKVKRWFYIIISLAITMCNCTELIQLSLLLLLKMLYF